jgi:hypothetical protein
LFKIKNAAEKVKEVVDDVQEAVGNVQKQVQNVRDQVQEAVDDSAAGQVFSDGAQLYDIAMEFQDEIQEAREIYAGERDGEDEEEEEEDGEEEEEEDGGAKTYLGRDGLTYEEGDEERPSLFAVGMDKADEWGTAINTTALAGGAAAVDYLGNKALRKNSKQKTQNLSAVEQATQAVEFSAPPDRSTFKSSNLNPPASVSLVYDTSNGMDINQSVAESPSFLYPQMNTKIVKKSGVGPLTRSPAPPVPFGATPAHSKASVERPKGFNPQGVLRHLTAPLASMSDSDDTSDQNHLTRSRDTRSRFLPSALAGPPRPARPSKDSNELSPTRRTLI